MSECKCEQNNRMIKYLWLAATILFMDNCIGIFPPTHHLREDIADSKQDIQLLTRQVQQDKIRNKEDYDTQLNNLRGRIYYLESNKGNK